MYRKIEKSGFLISKILSFFMKKWEKIREISRKNIDSIDFI